MTNAFDYLILGIEDEITDTKTTMIGGYEIKIKKEREKPLNYLKDQQREPSFLELRFIKILKYIKIVCEKCICLIYTQFRE